MGHWFPPGQMTNQQWALNSNLLRFAPGKTLRPTRRAMGYVSKSRIYRSHVREEEEEEEESKGGGGGGGELQARPRSYSSLI